MGTVETDDQVAELASLRARVRQLEAELEATRRDPPETSRLLVNTSHELRTPLAAILGYAEMMYDSRQSVAERLNCIGRIRQNVKVLTEVVENLVNLSKDESAQDTLCPVSFSLLPELGETLALLESLAWKKRLRLEVAFDGRIPDSICTDAKRLRQILVNVIGNAIQFTERGGVRINVSIHHGRKHPLLSFTVNDTGMGIPPERQASLFHPSVTPENALTITGGSGLGLVLARRWARSLGGDLVLVKSQPGRGSTFLITIDPGDLSKAVWHEEISKDKLSPRQTPPPNAERQLEGMRVLLVEDAQDVQVLIRHFLKRCGAEVEIAANGYEGIKKAKSGQYDLVLMDLQMPVLNGFEATAQLHREGFKSPIVALTAHAVKGIREKCLEVGCDAYVTKPINASTLLELMTGYYRRSRLESRPA